MNMMDTLEAQADEIPIEELTLAAKGIVNTLSNLIEVPPDFHRYTFVPQRQNPFWVRTVRTQNGLSPCALYLLLFVQGNKINSRFK